MIQVERRDRSLTNNYIFTEDGKVIGCVEVHLMKGTTHSYSYSFKYGKRDIRKFYNKYMKGELI